MILVMKNMVNEFVPGCDYTAVKVDAAIVDLLRRRAIACAAVRMADGSLAELRYWDAGPQCIGALDPDVQESVEEDLNQVDGWAILDDDALGSFDAAHADCTQMVISAGASTSVSWSYRVGSEPVRTADVPLDGLRRRLGSPLGDPLATLP